MIGLARALARVAFPTVCVHCRGLVEDESGLRHVCRACAAAIPRVASPHCPVCGYPIFGDVEEERMCVHCEHLAPAFREGRTAVLMRGAARSLVIELKYHKGLFVLEDVRRLFAGSEEICDFARGAVLVPVPLHTRKERERGYNQGLLLADCLAEAAGGGTVVRRLLRRIVDTETQTGLGRKLRAGNLKNAFALQPGAALNPAHHHILVDDVFTTGSTLNGCARVLRRAGCVKLDVVTFGHG